MAGKTLREDNVIFNLVTKIENEDKVDKLGKKANGLEGSFKKAGTAFSSIVGVASVGIALVGVGKMISKSLELAGTFEKTSVSFKTLTGSIKVAGDLVKELEGFSVVTPFTPDEVLKAGKTLLAFGVDANEVGDVINNLGEAAAATGGDMNNMAYIFGQARATGVLFTQDLNQLANAGLPILSLLADEMGEAEGNIRKLASQGKITFPILDRAFRRAAKSGGRFSGALKAQSETLLGLKSTAQGVEDAFFRAFGKRILQPAKEFQKVMIGLWTAATEFVKVGLAEELEEEQLNLNVLVSEITDANTAQERRNELVGILQDQYPDFLGNLDAETVSNKELTDRLKEVNAQYVARIALGSAQEEIDKQQAKLDESNKKAIDARLQAQKSVNKAILDNNSVFTQAQKDQLNAADTLEERLRLAADFLVSQEKRTQGLGGGQAANKATVIIDQIREAQNLSGRVESANTIIKRELAAAQLTLNQTTAEYKDVLDDVNADEAARIAAAEKLAKDKIARDKALAAANAARVADEKAAAAERKKIAKEEEKEAERIAKAKASREGDDFSDIGTAEGLGVNSGDVTGFAELFAQKLRDALGIEMSKGIFDGKKFEIPEPDLADPEALLTRAEQFEQLADSAQFAADVIQSGFDMEIERMDDLINAQQDRVNDARQIAERGNAEQLQLEEERLNKLLEKRQAAQKRQSVIDALSIVSAQGVAAAESVKAIAKGFGEGGLITGIATITALAASIGSIVLTVSNAFSDIPSFDVGTESVQGDMMANIHNNERILTASQNAQIGNIKNEDIPSLVNAGLSVMNGDYLYNQNNGEMVELLKENNDLNRSILDATYGDGLRLSEYMNSGDERRGISRRQRNLLN